VYVGKGALQGTQYGMELHMAIQVELTVLAGTSNQSKMMEALQIYGLRATPCRHWQENWLADES
jgi:hypothetical protein